MIERAPLSIEDEAVTHDCPLCALDFGGFGVIDETQKRYLEAAHRDVETAEGTVRQARRRLHTSTGLAPGSRDRWAEQERNALAAAEQLRARMRSVIAGEQPKAALELWEAIG